MTRESALSDLLDITQEEDIPNDTREELLTIYQVLQQPAPGGGWRPIETAPKDGFYIVWVPWSSGGTHMIGYTNELENGEVEYLICHYEDDDVIPDYWAPLPAPPKDTQAPEPQPISSNQGSDPQHIDCNPGGDSQPHLSEYGAKYLNLVLNDLVEEGAEYHHIERLRNDIKYLSKKQ